MKRKVDDNSVSGTETTVVPTCPSSTHSFAECFESPQAVMPNLIQEISVTYMYSKKKGEETLKYVKLVIIS